MAPHVNLNAEQIPGAVLVHARGEAPAGYEYRFFRDRTAEFPPRLSLMRRRSGEVDRGVQVPLDACGSFVVQRGQRVDAVTVRDQDEPTTGHRVTVDQAFD
jgi:hypothetical protein